MAVQIACARGLARISGDASRGLPPCCGRSTTAGPAVRSIAGAVFTELVPRRIRHPRFSNAPPTRTRSEGRLVRLTWAGFATGLRSGFPPMTRLLDDASRKSRMNAMIVLASWGEAASEALPGAFVGGPDTAMRRPLSAANRPSERISGKESGRPVNARRAAWQPDSWMIESSMASTRSGPAGPPGR